MSAGARLTVLGYAVVVAALLVLTLLAHRRGSGVPTLSAVLRWGLGRRDVQLALLLAWWWLGWHFLLDL